jgi:hypothetical protein
VELDLTEKMRAAGFTLKETTVRNWHVRGIIPPEPEMVAFLVRYCVKQGRLDKAWVESILVQARYLERQAILDELFPTRSESVLDRAWVENVLVQAHARERQVILDALFPKSRKSTFADNLQLLKVWVEALLEAGRVPVTFVDLDDTLTSHYGALIEPDAVTALGHVAEAGGLVGMNTGADIVWAGERALCETERHFSFPFLLLASGKRVYAWVDSRGAYVQLPIRAQDKGHALRSLAEYLDIPLDHFIYIADFPKAGDRQEGIDDPVLREPVGVVVNVGGHRPPEAITCAWQQTLLLKPERVGQGSVGTGCTATVQYLSSIAEIMRRARYTEHAKAFRAELMKVVERTLSIPRAPSREHRVWTFQQRTPEAGVDQSIRIRVRGQGMVHAGVSREGRWNRIYDVPLREVSPGMWEATLLDPEVNEFTFIWYDPHRLGKGHWEGRNFFVTRSPISDAAG